MTDKFSIEPNFSLPEEEVRTVFMNKKQAGTKAAIASFKSNDMAFDDFKDKIKEKERLIAEGNALQVQRQADAKAAEFKTNQITASLREALQAPVHQTVDLLERYKETKDRVEKLAEEEIAADNLLKYAETDPQYFAIIDRNRDFVERDRDRLAKDFIVADVAAEWEAKRDSFLGDVMDLPETLLGRDIDNLLTIDRAELYKEVQKKKEDLSPKEFKKYLTERLEGVEEDLFFDNNDNIADLASQLADEDIKTAMTAGRVDAIASLLSLVDVAALGKFAKGSKISNKTAAQKNIKAEAIVHSGGAPKVADEVTKVIRDGLDESAIFTSEREAIAYALANKLPWEQWDNVPPKVRESLEVNARILDELENLPISTTISAEDMKLAAEGIAKKYKASFNKGSLSDTKFVYTDEGNLEGVQMQILNESGVPFATKELAEDFAKKKKLSGYNVYRDKASGGYGILKVEKLDPTDLAPQFLNYRETGYFKSFLFQPDEFIAQNLMSLSRASEKSISRLSESLRSTWSTTIGKLNNRDRGKLGALMEEEKLKESPQWLSPGEFKERWKTKYNGETPKDKHLQAYLGARQMSDAAWRLTNQAVYERKQRAGFGTIVLETVPKDAPSTFNGRVIEAKNLEEGEFMLDAENGFITRVSDKYKDGIGKDKLVKESEKYDYIRVDTDQGLEAHGYNYHVVRVPKGQYQTKALDPVQVGYVPGGSIVYDYKFMVKAKRTKKLPDSLGGGTMVKNPVALFGARVRQEAREFAEKLEEVRKIALDVDKGKLSRSEGNVKIADVGLSRFQDADTVKGFLEARGVSLEDEIGFAADREPPIVNSEKGEFLANVDADVSFETFRTRWNSSRTKHRLEDVRGEVSLADPFESLTNSLNSASRLSAFSSFKEEAVSMFVRTFGDFMEVKPGPGVSDMDVLLSKIDPHKQKSLPRKTKASIEAHKRQILHTIRHRTPTEEMWANLMNDIADKFYGAGIKGVSDKFAKAAPSSPVGIIKSYSFNARMGFFNIGQLFLQASAAANIIALSPKHGLKAATSVFPARIALMARDPAVTKELAKTVSRDGLWDKDAGDFVTYVEEFRNLGLNDFGRNISEIDAASGKHYSSGAFGKFLEAGKVFFAEGERVPRLTAYGVAVRKWRTDRSVNPKGLPTTSNEGREFILGETERLTFGTTGADVQALFRGIRGIPGQFMSYPFRMLTTLSGKRLSGKEKARLLSMYIITSGAAGVPFASWLLDWGQKKGITGLEGESATLAYQGVIDWAVHEASDGELQTDWSSRIGPGTIFEDLYKDFLEEPTLTLLGGPTGASLGRGFDTLVDSLQPIVASRSTNVSQVGEAAVQTLSTQITSVDKLYKLLVALETKKLMDSKGRVFKNEATKAEIYTDLLLGIPLAERSKTFERLNDIQQVKQRAKDYAEDILRLKQIWYREYDNPEYQDLLQQQVNVLSYQASQLGIWTDVQRILSSRHADEGFSEEMYNTYMRNKYMGAELNPALQ